MNTAVVQKIIICDDSDNILLLKRSATDKKRPLQWDLPGGHAEVGESLEAAIIREAVEETGIQISSVQLVYATTTYHEWNDNTCNVVRPYYIASTPKKTLVTVSIEHEDYMWCPPDTIFNYLEHVVQVNALRYLFDHRVI